MQFIFPVGFVTLEPWTEVAKAKTGNWKLELALWDWLCVMETVALASLHCCCLRKAGKRFAERSKKLTPAHTSKIQLAKTDLVNQSKLGNCASLNNRFA